MLDKSTARGLLPLVNSPDYEALHAYAEYRIALLTNNLIQADDIQYIRSLQGQIRELQRLFGLREEAVQDAKE